MLLVDSNVWVSYLLHSRPAAELFAELQRRNIRVFLCPAIVADLRRAPQRKKLAGRINQGDVEGLLGLLMQNGEVVVPEMGPPVCRDPDDDNILYTARSAGAEFIVTGDKDLLVLGQFHGCRIVNMREMLGILRSR